MSQHTPGPWNEGTCWWDILGPQDEYVAQVRVESSDRIAEAEANAVLIAAAPELLAALEEMAAQHECGCGRPGCKACKRERMCADIIAKAKGQVA